MKSKKGAHKQHSPYRAARQVADDFSMFSFHFNSVTTIELGKSTFFSPPFIAMHYLWLLFNSPTSIHRKLHSNKFDITYILKIWFKAWPLLSHWKEKITFIFALPETCTHWNLTAVEFSMIFLEESSLHTSVNAFGPKYNVRWWMDLPHWPRIS